MQTDVQIKSESLSLQEIQNFVLDNACGGNAIFNGTVRNVNKNKKVTHLFFETYEAMALSEMRKIAERCLEKFDAKKIAIHHRVGDVQIGESAVLIAVSSMHRDAAFKACSYAIGELKKTVPIWKKEFLTDGSHWINARP